MPRTIDTRDQIRAAHISLRASIFLVLVKGTAGFASGSLSVLSDAAQSFLDIISTIAIIWTLRKANQPPDEEHPWGHGKIENLVSLVQIVIIVAGAASILFVAWNRLHAPKMPRVDWGIVALTIALFVDWRVSNHVDSVAKRAKSAALRAEAMQLRSDMYGSGGVLIGLILARATDLPWVDPVVAMVMALVIMGSAFGLLREALRPLMDEKLSHDEEAKIRNVLNSDPRVLDYHRLRTRSSGASRLVDVHILLDDHLSFVEAHDIIEEIEDEIRNVLPNTDIIAHAEPYHQEIKHQKDVHKTSL